MGISVKSVEENVHCRLFKDNSFAIEISKINKL